MHELLIHPGPTVKVIDSPIPVPNDDQVVIKVIVSGSNPKDWKRAEWYNVTINQGDDIAGIVHQVGDNVTEFKPGDRVAAFHEMMSPGGSYAEFAVAWAYTTFHLPKSTSFEEAATIPYIPFQFTPLAALTASMALFSRLPLPTPLVHATTPVPLIIYGGSSAVGSFALQLAARANIHPLLAIAGAGAAHVETLIDRTKGDTIIDYRQGSDKVIEDIRNALKATKPDQPTVKYAFDAITGHGSYESLAQVLDPHGTITLLLEYDPSVFPSTVTHSRTAVGGVHYQKGHWPGDPDLGYVYSRLIARGLADGWFKPHPFQVRPGGLGGVEKALRDLKEGKASATKYVFRICETEGLKN